MFLTLQIDDQVVFKDHVFQGPYVPYYDDYKGHIFEVVRIHDGQTYCTEMHLRSNY
jgi:hypothetical protein